MSDIPIEHGELSAEDIKLQKAWEKDQANRKLAEQARVNARDRAQKKLANLGLTNEEIEAVLGI